MAWGVMSKGSQTTWSGWVKLQMRVLGTTSKGVITKFDGLTRKICVGRSDETMNW